MPLSRLEAAQTELDIIRKRCDEYEVQVKNWQSKYFQAIRDGGMNEDQKVSFLGSYS